MTQLPLAPHDYITHTGVHQEITVLFKVHQSEISIKPMQQQPRYMIGKYVSWPLRTVGIPPYYCGCSQQ
jgi:hypothetical protein